MAKKITIFILPLLLLIFSIYLIPREKIIQFLSEKNQTSNSEKIDILFVFSGGFVNQKMGISTKERINYLKTILNKNPETPFVFLDYRGGKRLIKESIPNKFNDIYNCSSYKYSEKLGGTENNVLELISILKKHPELKNIGIVTSIYHEKRVKIILKYYLEKENFDYINIVFLHNNLNQEIYYCSFPRYIKLIFHELGGLIYFKLKTLLY